MLTAFLCVSFVLAVVYIFFMQERSHLEGLKENLTRELTINIQKEGMARSIKDRTQIVKNVMVNQKPWVQVLDRVSLIIPPPALSDISVDDQGKITISVRTDNVDTIAQVVQALIVEAKENRIVNPQLVSFQIGRTGSITVSLSFSMVFQSI